MREYLADDPSSEDEFEECNKCKLSFDTKQELEQHRKKNCYPVGKEKTVQTFDKGWINPLPLPQQQKALSLVFDRY